MKRIGPLVLFVVLLTACGTPLATGDDPTGIEGMSAADVIGAMQGLGYECSEPKKGLVHIGFSCVVTPNQVSVDGRSITIDEMAGVDIHVLNGDREVAVQLTRAIMNIPYEGSDSDAALAWMTERLDSDACMGELNPNWPEGCEMAFGSALLAVQAAQEDNVLEISLSGTHTTE